ncbi:MAG: glycosyltransferase family 2 protein [Microbacterium sp.]|nr:MAG: glycosyltransferase family 2 protein [Microbacterium sp.]
MSLAASGRTAVLVVNYGSHVLVEENLALTAMPEGAVVVVVDNFSSDAERESIGILAAREGWELLLPRENLGFGGGMNLAAARAIELGATCLVLLNPDAHLVGDGVAALAAQVDADASAVVAPVVERPDGRHFASEMELDLDTGDVRRVREGRRYDRSAPWLSGACLAISSTLWQRIGGFDDDYFLYWEDIDLSVRAVQAGGRLVVDAGIRAVHSAGGTQVEHTEQRGKSPIYYFYNVRNRLVFAAQHLDAASQRRWRRRSVQAAWSILLRGGRRQLLHPSRTLVPAWRGTRDGLAYMRRRAAGAVR